MERGLSAAAPDLLVSILYTTLRWLQQQWRLRWLSGAARVEAVRVEPARRSASLEMVKLEVVR